MLKRRKTSMVLATSTNLNSSKPFGPMKRRLLRQLSTLKVTTRMFQKSQRAQRQTNSTPGAWARIMFSDRERMKISSSPTLYTLACLMSYPSLWLVQVPSMLQFSHLTLRIDKTSPNLLRKYLTSNHLFHLQSQHLLRKSLRPSKKRK